MRLLTVRGENDTVPLCGAQGGACCNAAHAYLSFIAAATIVTMTAATTIVIMMMPLLHDSRRLRAPTPSLSTCTLDVRQLDCMDQNTRARTAGTRPAVLWQGGEWHLPSACSQSRARSRTRDPVPPPVRMPSCPPSTLPSLPSSPTALHRLAISYMPMKHLIRLWLEFALCAYCSSIATA